MMVVMLVEIWVLFVFFEGVEVERWEGVCFLRIGRWVGGVVCKDEVFWGWVLLLFVCRFMVVGVGWGGV